VPPARVVLRPSLFPLSPLFHLAFPLSGFTVVFAEDVPDVPEADFVLGAFANDSHSPKDGLF
jgi:hypothetical protein